MTMPVPWVAQWSSETSTRFPITVDPTGIRYQDGITPFVDADGFTWLYEEGEQGVGEPLFSKVSATRQRLCMEQMLCQVCGEKVTNRPIIWILKDGVLETLEGEVITSSPPTCEPCIEVALRWCPALQEGLQTLVVARTRPWGVWGQHYDEVRGDRVWNKHQRIRIGDPTTKFVLAKQALIELVDYQEVQV